MNFFTIHNTHTHSDDCVGVAKAKATHTHTQSHFAAVSNLLLVVGIGAPTNYVKIPLS